MNKKTKKCFKTMYIWLNEIEHKQSQVEKELNLISDILHQIEKQIFKKKKKKKKYKQPDKYKYNL